LRRKGRKQEQKKTKRTCALNGKGRGNRGGPNQEAGKNKKQKKKHDRVKTVRLGSRIWRKHNQAQIKGGGGRGWVFTTEEKKIARTDQRQ